jgi:hypothetical protein
MVLSTVILAVYVLDRQSLFLDSRLFFGVFGLFWLILRNIYKGVFIEIDKMGWLFGRKREVRQLKEDVTKSFDSVKDDLKKVGDWIGHIDGKREEHEGNISDMKLALTQLQADLEEIKDFVSFFGPQLSKQAQTPVYKQRAVEAVQTPVQTAVQTGILTNLTVMERAIVWALANSDGEMKLSYEDLSALLGKDKSTIRGQINHIKQKSEGLIEESREVNGKKRLYIPDKMRDIILKSVKVRVKSKKKTKKT